MKTGLRAFTLIEILIVVAIIGLLAGLFFTNTEKIFDRSRVDITRIFVRSSLKTAMVRYRIDVGDYPSTADGLAALLSAPAAVADRWHGPYADVPGGKLPVDPWGEAYQYRNPGTKNKGGYDLYSKGPDRIDGTDDDIGNW